MKGIMLLLTFMRFSDRLLAYIRVSKERPFLGALVAKFGSLRYFEHPKHL